MQHSYDELIKMPKQIDGTKLEYDAPAPGKTLEIKLMSSEDLSCKFKLSIYEGKHSSQISIAVEPGRKTSMQTRHRTETLVRVDVDERAKHTNPDGTVIEGSHVHIAKEGYGDRIAYPIDAEEAIRVIGNDREIISIFESFREFCHIEKALQVNWSLGI